jgi:bacterioferritin-associated ferredoxin
MIVCICNNVNSATIKSTLESGVTSLKGICEETGATSCCGKCKFKVNALIQDHIPEDNAIHLTA